jgi:4-amino-4-deoxy-L-arabinose transferase-like glycosyltransferase
MCPETDYLCSHGKSGMNRSCIGLKHKASKGAGILSTLFLVLILVGCREAQDFTQDAFARSGPEIYGEHTVGQTFVARHDDLSRIDVRMATYARPQLYPVVFVLKESPAAQVELARVIAPPLTVQDNAFYPFSFAPIPNSAGRSYYFEIQSPQAPAERPVTVWYQPADVYVDGEGYLEGRPVIDADMTFRTYYHLGSLDQAVSYFRSRLPESKPGIWGEPFFYDTFLVLYVIVLGVLFLSLLRLAWRSSSDNLALQLEGAAWPGKRWLLLLLLTLALVRGVIYASVTYPWQVPDEQGHYEYARLMLDQRQIPASRAESVLLQQEVISSMQTFDWWHFVGQPTPQDLPPDFNADPLLRLSRPQVGDEPPLYYLMPAVGYLFTHNESVELQLYAMRFASALFIVATVWLCYLVAQELFSDNRLLGIAIPALVALLPMFTYIGAGVNNDVGAAAAASWVFLLLARLFRRGATWRRAMWLLLAVGLALLVKKTNLFLVPSVVVAAIVYIAPRLKRGPWLGYLARGAAAIAGVMLVLLFVLSRVPTGDVWAWQERPRPWMQTQSDTFSRTGNFSIHLRDDSVDWTRKLVQTLPPGQMHLVAGKTVTLSAWVRGGGEGQPGMLLIRDSQAETSAGFVAGSDWTYVSVSHIIDPRAAFLDVVLIAGSEANESRSDLYWDDVALIPDSGSGSPMNNLLRNGSAEIPQSLLGALPEYLKIYFRIPVDMGDRLFDVRYYTPSQIRFYLLSLWFVFQTFWAVFAYLALRVSTAWYYLWAAVTLVAFIGVATKFPRMRFWSADTDDRPKILFVFGIALLVITLQTLLPMMRLVHSWMPQGRYMFPAIVPVSIFLVLGVRQVSPVRLRNVSVLALVIIAGVFDFACLFNYLISYFYAG